MIIEQILQIFTRSSPLRRRGVIQIQTAIRGIIR